MQLAVDVVIVGGGLAGMSAALAARSQRARVAILDRTGLGLGNNTAMSNGVFSGPTASYDAQQYVDDTLRIGHSLGRPWMARQVAADLPGAIDRLRSIGLEITEKKNNYSVVSGSGDKFPGVRLARVLAENLRTDQGLLRLGGIWIDRILLSGERAVGIHGFKKDGQEVVIKAGAVVLATGGAGAIYLRNDNQKSALGQGYALAAEAGLPIWDIEFVQYYPAVIAQAHLPNLMLYPPHPEGTRIISSDGRNLAEVYGIDDINDALRNRRDWLTAVLFDEWKRGPIYMDYRAVADHHWDRLPLALLKRRRFDFRSQPVAISPAAHFMMGGVRIEDTGATDLPGLFACGEVVWGLHGACRKGGNALSECLVFGQIAGLHAAGVLGADTRSVNPRDEISPHETSSTSMDGATLREFRQNLQTIAWKYAGVVRTADGLHKGLESLESLSSRIRRLPAHPPDRGRIRSDLLSMETMIRAILVASLARQESRGCFIRSDFPEENNRQWLKNSCVQWASGSDNPTVSHHPAETDSEERIY